MIRFPGSAYFRFARGVPILVNNYHQKTEKYPLKAELKNIPGGVFYGRAYHG
jgi:hypothetical protein